VPDFVVTTASRCARRLHSASLPYVLGHGDFEAQNLRWKDSKLWAVHDWDSLAWLPEASLVGAASGVFASFDAPTLAPLESSEAFLSAYQDRRGRRFTREEEEIAWAASLLPAVLDAREEAILGRAPTTTLPLSQQAEERLRRAGA
jgi:aminoglycoside phosphotransferase (APT) family kinase protein